MAITPGTRLGSYEITSLLGSGGMGQVYRAKDHKLERDVAIKVLREELASEPERLRRFEQEARSASALNHPNIIHIYDVGKHEGTHYIAMELVDGKTLREMLSEGSLSKRKLLQLATQIAEGLAKAHSAGIVHRDLKPENLMVSSDGYVKILDFGLAKLWASPSENKSEAVTATRDGTILGTVGYMSPEQAKGKSADHRSDQFSLGAILYEMATGKKAFQRDSAVQTLSAIIEDEPESIVALNPGTPSELRLIVERCLAKNSKRRYDSTQDLSRDLKMVEGIPSDVPLAPAQPRSKQKLLSTLAGMLVVVLAVLAGFNVSGFRDRLFGGSSQPAIESIAVLPLENLSGDPEQEYFADGMTEALIADLAKIKALRVISRQSVMQFKGSGRPLPEIARTLNVDAVIEGSVMRSGNRVRITTQLVQASPEQHLWAESYERDLGDILALQGDVARKIAEEIQATVTPEEAARLADADPVNPEAHEAYLKGRYFMNRRTAESLRRSLEFFRQSIEIEPQYALAHAGLSTSYSFLGTYALVAPREAFPEAGVAAARALEIDDRLGEAHAALAYVKFNFDYDWPGSEAAFRRAIELNPNDVMAHYWYSLLLSTQERFEESLAEANLARSLDPVSPTTNTFLAWAYYYAGDYDEAIEWCTKTLELGPALPFTHGLLGQLFLQKGMYPEAILECQKGEALSGGLPTASFILGRAYAEAGREREALEIVERLKKDEHSLSFGIATIFAGLEDLDPAFEWFEKAYEKREPYLLYIGVDPLYESLRSEPRFKDLLRRMNLPQ